MFNALPVQYDGAGARRLAHARDQPGSRIPEMRLLNSLEAQDLRYGENRTRAQHSPWSINECSMSWRHAQQPERQRALFNNYLDRMQ